MMTVENVYGKYFQKSKLFLYPLLKIRQGISIVPVQTYMRWLDMYELGDCKLICVYHKRSDDEYKRFEEKHLLSNPLFYDYFLLPDNMVAYVFDFSEHIHDYYKIAHGKYSELSSNFKFKVINFFSSNPIHSAYVDSYLYPDKHFNLYSELLNCNIELLMEVGELCSTPDIDQETLISKAILLEIEDNSLHLLKQ
jgi:hypothetical protein